jgi:PAS domain S-box-containing protein
MDEKGEKIQLLANVVESSDDAIISKSLDGIITTWNKGAELIYGYSAEEVIGKNISILAPSHLKGEIMQLIKKIKDGNRVFHYETVRVHKDSKKVDVSITMSPIFDNSRNLIGISTIARDITKQKISELALKESEEKFHKVFNKANDMITLTLIKDDNSPGKFIDVNEIGIQRLGYSHDEFLNMTPADIVPHEKLSEIPKNALKVSEKGHAKFEIIHQTKDGKRIPVEVNYHLFKLNGKKVILSISRDITERKQAEETLSRELLINFDLANISRKLLESAPIEDISDLVLEYAQKLTRSKFGFVGYIDPKTSYLISPTMTRNIWTECHVIDKSIIFEKFGGMWGWVLNNKESILTNEPQNDSRSTGTPTGHIEIDTFLAVPAMVNKKLVGIISLANADKYDKQDLEVVESLSSLYAIAINRKQSDETIKKSEEKYRNIVEKFLKISNEILIEISKKD